MTTETPTIDTPVAPSLPPPLTSFLGRELDLEKVRELVAPGRLVTLTGGGGAGKTRLAEEVARRAAASGPAVRLAALAPVQDPDLVPSAVAVALGVREEPGRPLGDVVIEHLRPRTLLLVLDNCEHVLPGVRTLLTRVLLEARGVALLATSREPLRLHGERIWPVAPLTVPGHAADPSEVAESSAARLFLDRARQVRPDFELTADCATAVAVLCRQLGGLPLAIELIAPWTRALGVEEMVSRLDELVRLSADRGAEARHRSIEAALDWSYELLTDRQQSVFLRLSVFVGGFSLEAAEAVAGDAARPVLPILVELVDKGLVTADAGAGDRTRYRLLEPVRQYAERRLEGRGEAPDARADHLAFYVRFAETAERKLHVAEQVTWLARLDEDHANLRVAYEWGMTGADPTGALRIAGALWWYWWLRGHVQEGSHRLARALEASDDRGASRAKALVGAGGFLLITGPYDRAVGVLEESAELCRGLGHEAGLARAIGTLARIEYNRGNLEVSERLANEALEMYRRLDNPGGVAWLCLVLGGAVGAAGDPDRHRRLVEEAAALFGERGDRWGLGWVHTLRGDEELIRGDPSGALAPLDRALTHFTEIGNRDEAMVYALAFRAVARLRTGDPVGAQADAIEAVDLGLRTGDTTSLAAALAAAAEITAVTGGALDAAEILGAAIAMPDVRPHGMATLVEAVLDALRPRLDRAVLEAALERGARRPVHDVPDVLRAVSVPIPPASVSAPTSPTSAVLVQEGDYWAVQLGSESTKLRDLKGLRYLAHLLAHPGQEFHVLDLVAEVEQVPAEEMDRSDAGPLLDPQAKAAYRRRLQDLEEELEEAEMLGNDLRAERARGEREALARELASAVGLGGRDRRAGAASERARVNVTRLIGTVLRRLEQDCPSLAHLLGATVRTGTYCAYEPPPDGGPRWTL